MIIYKVSPISNRYRVFLFKISLFGGIFLICLYYLNIKRIIRATQNSENLVKLSTPWDFAGGFSTSYYNHLIPHNFPCAHSGQILFLFHDFLKSNYVLILWCFLLQKRFQIYIRNCCKKNCLCFFALFWKIIFPLYKLNCNEWLRVIYMKCPHIMLSDCASDRIFELCLISKYLQSGRYRK